MVILYTKIYLQKDEYASALRAIASCEGEFRSKNSGDSTRQVRDRFGYLRDTTDRYSFLFIYPITWGWFGFSSNERRQ